MDDEESRIKTMAELSAEAAGTRGIECRRCGCRDFRVRDTDKGDGYILRYRVCRHCGTVRKTIEK